MSKKTILLHICCAPCAYSVIESLREAGFEVRGFFYNPNIHGKKEYLRRLQDVEKLAGTLNFPLEVPNYNVEEYFSALYRYEKKHHRKIENDPKFRCPVCYRLRLEQTARRAQKIGADYFSTTLLISPYQQQSVIWQIGVELGEKYGVPFYFRDWRKSYWQSLHRAKAHKYYLPTYCGCVYSLKEKTKEANR